MLDVIRILCVDDEPTMLSLERRLLEPAGFGVSTAACGQEAIQIFQDEPIDIVLMDYWMTGMNGIDTAEHMKRLHPEVPIVFFSAYSELPSESLGLAETWLRKGQEDPEDIISLLRSIARRAALIRAS
ncbi:MAG TPA: response regulator [Terriglobales bacterium]|jgi:CheY-like chemotaxis protein|nr:response regulator [Terriglobales bacterium]